MMYNPPRSALTTISRVWLQVHAYATADSGDVLEPHQVDPYAFNNGKGEDSAGAKYDLIAAYLKEKDLVPAAPSGTAVRKRWDVLQKDALAWLVRTQRVCMRSRTRARLTSPSLRAVADKVRQSRQNADGRR